MKPVILLCTLLLIAGCEQAPEDHTYHHQIFAFGTIIDVTLRHHDETLVQRAFKRLETDFQTMHKVWHPWEASSLTRTNALLQTGQWFTSSTSVLPIFKRSKDLAVQSQHYFNPALGKLVGLWGFHRQEMNQPYSPDIREIKRIQANIPNMDNVEIEGIRMRGTNPDIQVDLGGIAKGFGIDQAIETLQIMDIKHAIINTGGDLRAIGKHGNRPWKIGIQHPRQKGILASIEVMEDESIFTSGDYQRYYMQGDSRRHHIIDPISGEPVSHTIAVTVIHSEATTADAAATALLAAGEKKLAPVAKSMGIKYIMLMNSEGKILVNQAMRDRLDIDGSLLSGVQLIDL